MRPDQNDDEQPPTPEEWAERHDGLFTREVAAAAGLTRQQLSHRRTIGRSRAIRRGVDAIGGAPLSRRQVIRALSLTVSDDVCMSHSTAAWLLGGPCPGDDWLHVSGPGQRYPGPMASSHFRAGVVIVVRSPDLTQVMAFERADAPGSWQLPQGGLKAGEPPIDGAWRELLEETGLGELQVVVRAEFPEWLAYEWPDDLKTLKGGNANRIGQVQRWFLFDAVSADVVPTPDGAEFTDWKWVTPEWLISHVMDWRRPPYERVLGTL